MKCFIILALVAAASAVPALLSGSSSQFRSQDNAGNYAFGYNEGHATGSTFRKETGSPGVKVGSYGLRDADGRVRTVTYVADAAGFRANVQSNEPGVEPKDPAAVIINKPGMAAPLAYAPAPLLASAPAPLLAAAPAPYYGGYGGSYAGAYAAPAYAAPAYGAVSYSSNVVHAAAPAHYGGYNMGYNKLY